MYLVMGVHKVFVQIYSLANYMVVGHGLHPFLDVLVPPILLITVAKCRGTLPILLTILDRCWMVSYLSHATLKY